MTKYVLEITDLMILEGLEADVRKIIKRIESECELSVKFWEIREHE